MKKSVKSVFLLSLGPSQASQSQNGEDASSGIGVRNSPADPANPGNPPEMGLVQQQQPAAFGGRRRLRRRRRGCCCWTRPRQGRQDRPRSHQAKARHNKQASQAKAAPHKGGVLHKGGAPHTGGAPHKGGAPHHAPLQSSVVVGCVVLWLRIQNRNSHMAVSTLHGYHSP